MWRTGLVAPWHVGSSWTRARTRVPCVGRRIRNHCATREGLSLSIRILTQPVLCPSALVDGVWIFLEFSSISHSCPSPQAHPRGMAQLQSFSLGLFEDPCTFFSDTVPAVFSFPIFFCLYLLTSPLCHQAFPLLCTLRGTGQSSCMFAFKGHLFHYTLTLWGNRFQARVLCGT